MQRSYPCTIPATQQNQRAIAAGSDDSVERTDRVDVVTRVEGIDGRSQWPIRFHIAFSEVLRREDRPPIVGDGNAQRIQTQRLRIQRRANLLQRFGVVLCDGKRALLRGPESSDDLFSISRQRAGTGTWQRRRRRSTPA